MTHSQYLAELSRIRISGSVIDDESLTKTEYLERKGEKKSHSISTCMNGGRRLVTQKKFQARTKISSHRQMSLLN